MFAHKAAPSVLTPAVSTDPVAAPAAVPRKNAAVAPLPFSYQFTAGAIAGVTEICFMYPLDVVKTRFQLQVTGEANGYSSIVDCFRKIIKTEGVGSLYRGMLAPVLVEAPKRATKFAANEQFQQLYMRLLKLDKPTPYLSVLTGVSAGLTEAMLVTSFELIKIRMQDKNNVGLYNGTFDCIKKIYRAEGPLGFFRGLEATAWRHSVWSGGYFGIIHTIRSNLPEAETKQGQLAVNFAAGALGGTFGTLMNTPFDVVKSRVQSGNPKYNWTIPAVGRIAREEGFSALYKGFVPKVLRLGPGGGVLLVVYDVVTTWMRKNLM